MRMKPGLIALVAVLAAGCGGAASPGRVPTPAATEAPRATPTTMPTIPPNTQSAAGPAVTAAGNDFALRLFARLAKDRPGNVFVSPLSVSTALAMTYNGAHGDTAARMAETLGLRGLSLADVNAANAQLLAQLRQSDTKTRLDVANAIFARSGVAFKPDFLARATDFYAAQVESLDFGSPGALGRINGWVSDRTNGKIAQMLDRIPTDAVLYLLNAVYFKGEWQTPFEAALTRERPFTSAAGVQKATPMMHRAGRMSYFKGERFQAVALPYSGGRLEMLILLPDPGSSLLELYGALSAENWERWMRSFQLRDGELDMPRFRFETSLTLNDALKSMGMAQAFEQGAADFSAMSDQQLFIDEVRHKAFVEVDERGTEAAAATSVGMGVTSAREPSEPFKMLVDRPFVFAIRDKRTGAIVFTGAVAEP